MEPPARPPEAASGEDTEVLYEGFLYKRGHKGLRNWKLRFFVVKGPLVAYYAARTATAASLKGAFLAAKVREWPEEPLGWIIEAESRKVFFVRAETHEQRAQAIEAMRRSAAVNRLHRERDRTAASSGRTAPVSPRCLTGVELGKQGLISEAVATLMEVTRAVPTDAEAWYHLGTAQLCSLDEQSAVASLQRAVALQEDLDDARLHLGVALYVRGDLARAREALEYLTSRRANDAAAHTNLGLCYLEEGRLDDAEACMRKAIQSGPGADAYLNLGDVLTAKRQHDAAVDAYARAGDLEATSVDVNLSLGKAYRAVHDHGLAVVHLRRVLEVNPLHAEALELLEHTLDPRDGAKGAAGARASVPPGSGGLHRRRATGT